jgi:alkanesulfonate monooxygenase SsuD/methylene tetrahydromethanopterin reductase-like flavin-dependent oxidoreductase (luciferase family)
VRPGGIPSWIGGRTKASLRRVAEVGAGWMSILITPEDFRQGWGQLGDYAATVGPDPASITGAIHVFASIGPSYESAANVLAPAIEAIFHSSFAHFAPLCLAGTADHWVEQIERYAEAGVRHVNVLLYTHDLIGDVQHIGVLGLVYDQPVDMSSSITRTITS